MSLYAITEAHELGYDENVYLDSATRTCLEETGGANLIFITKDGTLVTPKSGSILPSITRRSLIRVAGDLGIPVEERPIRLTEVADFAEAGLCGTAAVLAPVGSITDTDRVYRFDPPREGSVITRLYETLHGMQEGTVPAPEGWIETICE